MKELTVLHDTNETTFIFYRCDNKYCGKKYAIEEEATEEPICPCCGGYYFEHITDRNIEI